MSDDKDLQQARVSAAADEERRGLVTSGGGGSVTLSLAGRTRDLLRRHGLRPRKSLGQNFLINPVKVEEIATAALEAAVGCGVSDLVEVGPGLGALTAALANGGPADGRTLPDGGPSIVAFEIDRYLEAPLAELLGVRPQVTVRYEDFLRADLREIFGGRKYVLAGNLPYNITAALLEKLLMDPLCAAMVITVQREVAERLRAGPGSKAYGPLTLFCAYYVRTIDVVTQLHPGDFLPPPTIDSTALRLVKRTEPPFEKPSAEAFERAVRGAFNHRRKSLRSGLALTTRLGMTRDLVEDALEQAEINGDRRAETLNMGEFARLAQALDEVRSGA